METWRAANVPSLPGPGAEPYLVNTATGELTRAAAGQRATPVRVRDHPVRRDPPRARGDLRGLGPAGPGLAGRGHEVTYVQNVTDVDDPLLERADRDGEDWRDLADREIARYRGDMEALRMLPPTRLVGAVEALPLIERLNQVLADRGALYELDRDVYFSRAADPAFGAVSHLDPATMAGAVRRAGR